MKLKSYIIGMLINVQFFSTIPVPVSLPMEPSLIRRSVAMFPLFGLFLGSVNGILFFLLSEWTSFSPLTLAFILWAAPIILTGGIHLDGWMDTSDAYFSYQDPEKRLEIMKDSRSGAFSVLSIIVLLSARFLFIYESILYSVHSLAVIIALIPLFSRILMGAVLVLTKSAREEGMAFYFKKHTDSRLLLVYGALALLVGLTLLAAAPELLPLFILFGSLTGLTALMAIRWISKHFGGMTGDTLGASVEGMEVLLWMVVWLSVYTGTVQL